MIGPGRLRCTHSFLLSESVGRTRHKNGCHKVASLQLRVSLNKVMLRLYFLIRTHDEAMSYASVHHDVPLDTIADVDHAISARIFRVRLYAWGQDNPFKWHLKNTLVSATDFDDIVVVTGLYSNFARFFFVNSFNHEKVDVYFGRNTRTLKLLNMWLLLALIFLRVTTTRPESDTLLLSLYAVLVVLFNAAILHFCGTCGGIVVIVKKTIQAFPISSPVYTPHVYPWWSCCACRTTVTGSFKFTASSRDLLTVCGGLMSGDNGNIQLSELMKEGRSSMLLLGDFGRPVSHFATIERNPFALLVEHGSMGIMGQQVTVSPGSTGSTSAERGDNKLASIFVTVSLAAGDSDGEEVTL